MKERLEPLPSKIESKEFGGQTISLEYYIPATEQSEEVRYGFAKELTPLVAEGFMRSNPNDPELFQDVINHVVTAARLIIARNQSHEAIAFIASETININGHLFYDLGGIIVTTKFQGSGLALDMLKNELEDTQSEFIVLRTQNMRMYQLADKVAILSDELAATVAPSTHYTKNLKGSINYGAYRKGHSLYEDEVRFAPHAISWINWRDGDALVVAGSVRNLDQQR